jgi:hypothetical protein
MSENSDVAIIKEVTKTQTDLKETVKPKRSSTDKDKKSKDKSQSKASAETLKKTFKVVIRKLPIRDFSNDDFRANVSRVLLQLGYNCPNPDAEKELIQIEYFIEGKLRYIETRNNSQIDFKRVAEAHTEIEYFYSRIIILIDKECI